MVNNKLILSDADGVLLNWLDSYFSWMERHGYKTHGRPLESYDLHLMFPGMSHSKFVETATTFNESAEIGFISAYLDSAKYVNKLHTEYGYKFRIISSLGSNKYARILRERNLRELFGDAIEEVKCLSIGEPKDKELQQYKGSGLWWIEDHTGNADAGDKIGLNSILMEHGHNVHHRCNYPVVKNWEEIYELISSTQ